MTPTPPPQVWPTLIARDARGLIKFLVDAFGFEETTVYGEGDHVDHAELAWPSGGGVMMGSAPRPGLRLARVLGARPGGEPMVVRHLPGPPALIIEARGRPAAPGGGC
jgi:hypothetical protein